MLFCGVGSPPIAQLGPLRDPIAIIVVSESVGVLRPSGIRPLIAQLGPPWVPIAIIRVPGVVVVLGHVGMWCGETPYRTTGSPKGPYRYNRGE